MNSVIAGRYRLVREIGAGGMGRVFQAVDTESGRPVAAKVMLATSEDSLQALLRFYQEGAVLSTLKHPNIVQVHGTFLEDQVCCIIMELLEGRSLGEMLRSGSPPLPAVRDISRQVTAALGYAHSRGIIHRDIKPDNIMVGPDGSVKVTDFGIARVIQGATLNTATGQSIGTPLYMAPEQIEGQRVDGRADIYSLGAVMYQMVTGRPPFEGTDPLTIAFKHVHRAPSPPTEFRADVPSDWEALILRCLAKNPTDRFQTASALEEAITSLSGGQAVTATVWSRARLMESPPSQMPPIPDPTDPQPLPYRPSHPTPRPPPSTASAPQPSQTWSSQTSSGWTPQPVPPRKDSGTRWLWLAVLVLGVIVAAAGGAFAYAHLSAGSATPTLQPVPTSRPATTLPTTQPGTVAPTAVQPTAAPPPTTAPPPDATGAVDSTVRLSNDRWTASMECACDNDLEAVKTDGDLQTALGEVTDLQSRGERWNVILHSWSIASTTIESSTAASVIIDKNETRQVFRGSAMLSSCTGPFHVRYHLTNIGGVWKVDTTQTLSSSCS